MWFEIKFSLFQPNITNYELKCFDKSIFKRCTERWRTRGPVAKSRGCTFAICKYVNTTSNLFSTWLHTRRTADVERASGTGGWCRSRWMQPPRSLLIGAARPPFDWLWTRWPCGDLASDDATGRGPCLYWKRCLWKTWEKTRGRTDTWTSNGTDQHACVRAHACWNVWCKGLTRR